MLLLVTLAYHTENLSFEICQVPCYNMLSFLALAIVKCSYILHYFSTSSLSQVVTLKKSTNPAASL